MKHSARLAVALLVLSAVGGAQPPAPCPPAWRELLGQYGDAVLVRENEGRLEAIDKRSRAVLSGSLRFERDAGGKVTGLRRGASVLRRVEVSPYRITPRRPLSELRREAMAATPPHETGTFRSPDLVDLAAIDPSIHLDIRYAGKNNFLGTPLYTEARAFLQRPAAAALLRVYRKLAASGYGLLIHDAYRPWFVTRMFWDATPVEKRIFVADPKEGSRHNRGCAVDLTLYDLATGRAVEMTGAYDEMSERSYPDYPGGTSLARWDRDLLRHAMEAEDFTVYPYEWWHFDYRDWKLYSILDVPFEDVPVR